MQRGIMFILAVMLVGCVVAETVTVVNEPGDFTGAYMRFKTPVGNELSEKVYPSQNLASSGIMTFELETVLSEVALVLVFHKDGSVVEKVDAGPFVLNDSDFTVDLREKAVEEVVDAPKENLTEKEDVIEKENVSVNVSTPATGYVLQGVGSGVVYSIAGVVVALLFLVALIFILIRKKKEREEKEEAEILAVEATQPVATPEEMELADMERQVEETEKKIDELKSKKKRDTKIVSVKKKLIEEQEELRKLESGEEETADTVEEAKKPTEKVESLDSF
jgi:hypothetical protein